MENDSVPQAPQKSRRQERAEADSKAKAKYYPGWPTIHGHMCEYTGLDFRQSPFYKKLAERFNGKIIALDGTEIGDQSKQHVKYLYVPHRGIFVSDTNESERLYYQRFGGFEQKVSWHIFARESPYYGSLLPDPMIPPREDLAEVMDEVAKIITRDNLIASGRDDQ